MRLMSKPRSWRGTALAAGMLLVLAATSRPGAEPPRPADAPPQVAGVTAVHRDGQTFITWREIDPPAGASLSYGEYRRLSGQLAGERRIRYRIYRSTRPIDSLEDATVVGEVGPLTGWNAGFDGRNPPPERLLPRYVIEDAGPPLPPDLALFVFNPSEAGRAFYAVSASAGGVENRQVSADSSSDVVVEAPGRGTPVLQRVEEPATFQFIDRPTLRFYVRWEVAPNSSVDGKPFDYLVAVPRGVRSPAPVGIHLHGWGGSMTRDFGWWFNAEKGAILVASNQEPYDWWTGYHERMGRGPLATPLDWQAGVVRPYTERRLFSFVDWLATTMQLDLTRTFTGGISMGGSGAIMLAIRNPDRVAWAISWVGVHVPAESPTFRSSYEDVYGRPEWNVRFEDGTPVWDYYNDAWYLREHPDRDVGFITFSNGKNDQGIGWSQAVEFFRALQDTRQPHLFVWGQAGHGQRAVMPADGGQRVMPLDLRIDQSLPAFTRSTLDDDPGDGTPDSGAPAGQANLHLTWRPDSIVDEADRWSVEIALADSAPRSDATVDVTPRRLQRFTVTPGEVLSWTTTRGRDVVQEGEVTADQWGLITLPQVIVTRGGTRVTVARR